MKIILMVTGWEQCWWGWDKLDNWGQLYGKNDKKTLSGDYVVVHTDVKLHAVPLKVIKLYIPILPQ